MLSIFFCRKERPQRRPDLGQHGGRESENECGFLGLLKGGNGQERRKICSDGRCGTAWVAA